MNRPQAQAFMLYLQRCVPIVPTTYVEASVVRDAVASVEAVANGIAVMEVKPVEVAPQIRPGPTPKAPRAPQAPRPRTPAAPEKG